jgi:CheY-like chemotaxis protein
MPQITRILIVEDDRFNVRLLSEVCRNSGYEADVVMDGLEALAAIERDRPDLVLLDLMIPGLDGYGVLERLRANPDTADLPVILVTAVQDREARARAIDLGADDWVAKPFKLLELQQRIRAAAQMRAFKRQLTRDVTPPAGRARPKLPPDDTQALDLAIEARRGAGEVHQVVCVDFSPDGEPEVLEAIVAALRRQVEGTRLYRRSGRRLSFLWDKDALSARRAAAELHGACHAARAECGTARPRIYWGIGADRISADAACTAAREADLEPDPPR